jgi:hypothetical protein
VLRCFVGEAVYSMFFPHIFNSAGCVCFLRPQAMKNNKHAYNIYIEHHQICGYTSIMLSSAVRSVALRSKTSLHASIARRSMAGTDQSQTSAVSSWSVNQREKRLLCWSSRSNHLRLLHAYILSFSRFAPSLVESLGHCR